MLLIAEFSKHFCHGVGCPFNRCWQRGGELVLIAGFHDLLLRFGCHHLANQAAKAFANANGPHARAFVQSNQSARGQGTQQLLVLVPIYHFACHQPCQFRHCFP
jgi:hypothetical protein